MRQSHPLDPGPRSRVWWLMLASVALTGCASPVGTVTGKVTVKDKPVAGAELSFEPADREDEHYFGVANNEGAYQVSYRTKRGLPLGRYRVVVSRYLWRGKPLPPGEGSEALRHDQHAVRESYLFEKDIAAGVNPIDFELTQGKKIEQVKE